MIQSAHRAGAVVLVALGLTGVQVVVGNLVEPRLMGNTLNLSPHVVLLSLV